MYTLSFSFLVGILLLWLMPHPPTNPLLLSSGLFIGGIALWIGFWMRLKARMPIPQLAVNRLSNQALANKKHNRIQAIFGSRQPIDQSQIGLVLVGLWAGFSLMNWQVHQLQQHYLPTSLESKTIQVTGKIIDIPRYRQTQRGNQRGKSAHFLFDVDPFQLSNQTDSLHEQSWQGGVVKLAWYQGVPDDLQAGERWQLQLKLKQPHGFVNGSGFDYEKHLFRDRIVAQGYVKQSANNQHLAPASTWSINALRQARYAALEDVVEDSAIVGLLGAVTLAIKHDIPTSVWETLQSTGTSHLMAISGLHIALVAGFGVFFIRLIWWLFPSLYRWLPAPYAGLIGGAILAVMYAALAGFSVSTQRALLMVLIVLWGLLGQRSLSLGRIWATALLLVLVFDPFAVLDAGFWLSFSAVALIFYLIQQDQAQLNVQKTRWRTFKLTLKIQLFLSLSMIPLTTALFGTASWTSPLANMIAIPWVSFFVVPPALLGMLFEPIIPQAAVLLWQFAAWAIEPLLVFLQQFMQLPMPTLYLPQPPWWLSLIALSGILLLFAPRYLPARWLGLVLLSTLFLYQVPRPQHGAFEFVLLDSGQGLASVVKTARHTFVYDVGFAFTDGMNIGEQVLVPYLRAQGVRHLDQVMVSHLDNDHRGGLEALLAKIPANTLMASEPLSDIKQPTQLCYAGQQWTWDGVLFEVLHPPKVSVTHHDLLNPTSAQTSSQAILFNAQLNDVQRRYKKRNNRSCVLKVSNASHSLLLTADIEKRVESDLQRQQSDKLMSEVLLMPHHGSKTSSTNRFIKAVNPSLAVVSSGYRNRFRHPHEQVLQRYRRLNIPILNTADTGAVQLSFPADDRAIVVETQRQQAARFWHHVAESTSKNTIEQ
ncbi:MAG: DNA internalization-related competence protein ComEC/Rec2 [bacterium]